MKDTIFFNAESRSYSLKRYPVQARTFTQFFFKERLVQTIHMLSPVFAEPSRRVLELGCADGIVAARIHERFAGSIATFDATDIASEMITAARTLFPDAGVQFAVRTETPIVGTYDAIIEVGVLNYTDLEPELQAVRNALAPGARYVCSIAGASSLQARLKGAEGYAHLFGYKEYESIFSKYFDITERRAVGFFIPYLWKIPVLARILQPFFEVIGRTVNPGLALEYVYVLEART